MTSVLLFALASIAKTTLLLALAWAAAIFLRRHSAALRHRVWAMAMLGSLALPALAWLLPVWRTTTFPSPSFLASVTPRTAITGPQLLPSMIVSAARNAPLATRLADWLVAAWLVGASLAALTLLIQIFRLAFLAARAKPLFDRRCLLDVANISRSLGLSRPVRLLESSSVAAMPATWGVFGPRILVPSDFAGWPDERRQAVLTHELSHVVRRDWLLQICVEVARGIYWFHPLAWIAARRLRRESESACDDAVVNSGMAPWDYAGHLLNVIQTLESPRLGWPAAVAMARASDFGRRMIAILDLSTNRRRLSRNAKLFTALAAVGLLLPLAALRLNAQASGRFTGAVYDASGAAVPNATVILANHQARTRDMTASDAAGNFTFTGLPAGDYEMHVLKNGFAVFREPHIVLDADRDFAWNVSLEVGEVDQRVEVSARGAARPDPQAEVGQPPSRIRVGGSIQAANLLNKVMPVYPHGAKAAGISGTVILQAIIGNDGALMSLRVMNSQIDPDLARSAVEAVSRWRYRPTLLNGEPVEVVTKIEVNFTLKP